MIGPFPISTYSDQGDSFSITEPPNMCGVVCFSDRLDPGEVRIEKVPAIRYYDPMENPENQLTGIGSNGPDVT